LTDDEPRELPPGTLGLSAPRSAAPTAKWALDFAPGVMEQIARAAELGSPGFAHGGVQIRGILNGSIQRRTIVIESWTAFPYEPDYGPGLSEMDRAKLLSLAGSSGANPARGGTAVGWVVSHAHGGPTPGAGEIELFNEFFPHPWQLLLVVNPLAGRAAHAAFFLREANGTLNTQRPYRELQIRPNGAEGDIAVAAESHPVEPTHGEDATADTMHDDASSSRSPLRWAWLALPALAILAAIIAYRTWFRPVVAEETPDLSITDVNHELLIRWNTPASLLTDAGRGELSIRDGGTDKTIPLAKNELRHGSVTWARQGADVRVHLGIWHGGRQANAVAQFFGPQQPEAAAPPPANDELDRLKAENATLRTERDRANARVAEAEAAVRILRNRLNVEQPGASTQK
jgi:hypothetical protein